MTATVLVVDDTDALRATTKRMLEDAGLDLRVIEAEDGAQALPVALSGDVDIVVSDIVMPRLDGIGLLRGIRQQRDWDSLPVILMTSQAESETRDVSFEAGANDYISRPFSAEELVARIRVQLRLLGLQDELRRAGERQRRLGMHDDLTGLVNRRHFLDLARRELSRSRRHKLALSVSIVTVDHFSRVAGSAGALEGDALLTEVAGVLAKNLRTADILARTGPQKFAALLPHTDAAQAHAAGERMRAAARNHAFTDHVAGHVTVSVGVATYPTGSLESVDEIVNAAEASLDRASARGGDRVEAWTDDAV